MRHWRLLIPLLTMVALLVAACAPAAAPTPTPTKAPEKAAATPAAPQATPTTAAPAAKPTEAKPPVTLGVILSLVGPVGTIGTAVRQGFELALDDIHAKGGIDGRKVELIVEDDEGQPAKATTAATKLIQKDRVVAILGAAVTATTVAAAQVANAEKVVLLSPTFTGDTLTAPGSGMDYVFRVGFPDRYSVAWLVQYGAKKYGKIGVFTDSGPAGGSVTAIATKLLTELGKPPVATQTHDTRSPDMTPQLLNLQKAGAEAIIVQAVPGDAATIAKGMKQIGYNAQILGHFGFADPTVRDVALDAVQGAIVVDTYDPDKTEQQKFLDAYKKKYGADKPIFWTPLLGSYDAMLVMAEALKRANFDGSRLKGALESITDFPAVNGNRQNKLSYGPGQHDGNRENSVLLLQIKGKDLVKVE